MMTDPILPLRQLLNASRADEALWREQAVRACAETLNRIVKVQQEASDDRDTSALLDAVRHTLEWVLNEPATAAEIEHVANRASRAFDGLIVHAH